MDSMNTGKIYGINGPVIYLKGRTGLKMSEMVYVGKERLVGEVISLDKDMTTIQVYEETSGLRPGEVVEATGNPCDCSQMYGASRYRGYGGIGCAGWKIYNSGYAGGCRAGKWRKKGAFHDPALAHPCAKAGTSQILCK